MRYLPAQPRAAVPLGATAGPAGWAAGVGRAAADREPVAQRGPARAGGGRGKGVVPVAAAATRGAAEAMDADHQVAAVIHAQGDLGLFAGAAGIIDGDPLAHLHGRGAPGLAAGVVEQPHLHAGTAVAGRTHAGIQGHILAIHRHTPFASALTQGGRLYYAKGAGGVWIMPTS